MDFALSRVYTTKILQVLQNSTATGTEPSQGALQGARGPAIRLLGRSRDIGPCREQGRRLTLETYY